MYLVYSALLAAGLLVSLPYWLLQRLRHGKYRFGLGERLGRISPRLRPLDKRPAIWVHAVSVGEVLAVSGLVEELNFPAMPAVTGENWRKTLDDFRASNHTFRQALARLDPAKLNDLTAAGRRTYYGEAHGIIEHHVYHLGQITLLKT